MFKLEKIMANRKKSVNKVRIDFIVYFFNNTN